jgi:hypothetical protein
MPLLYDPASAAVADEPRLGVASAPLRTADGSTDAEVCVGVAVGAGVGTAALVRVAELFGVGLTVRVPWVGRVWTGSGDAEGLGGAEGLVAGGGASGTVGEAGDSCVAKRSGSAMTAATAHDRPTPAAARSSRRRAAPRRITSYRPGGGPR